ncbi:MAG: hypothetical protein FGM24_10695, partial [Candidatus Kapabacteria bacterium]|nr:hypothetical protein [Candidatus Kapabacteria bacterium]
SDGATAMFGYSKDEAVGKMRVSNFSPGEVVLQNLGTWLSTAVKEGEWSGETNFIRKNGEMFGARIRITPTFKGGVQIGYCGVTEELDKPVHVDIRGATKMLRWLVITRAPFLAAAITPAFVGVAYAAGIMGVEINWLYATLGILGVALLHLASNVFNDYFDYTSGTDQANTAYFTQYSGGSRSIEMRLIDLKGTRNTALLMAAIAFGIGLYLTAAVGTGILVMGFIGLACGYFYTAPPLRLVARHGLGEIIIGLAFGPLITMGMYYVVTGLYSWEAFLFGIPAGLLTTNILVINQVPDTPGDASTGKNHLLVTFGIDATPVVYGIFWGISTAVTFWLAMNYAKPYLYVPAAASLVGGIQIIAYMRRHLHERSLVRANVNTIKLQLLVTMLFAIALVL